MIVLSLTDCPTGLRGDLTKWLFEIESGVFVGQVSARVRDALWNRVKNHVKKGRAILVFNTHNEQKIDFRIHGSTWEPIDFDGLKLMLRPSRNRRTQYQNRLNDDYGFSNAAKIRAAKKFSKNKAKYPNNYIVLSLKTTGQNAEKDKIIEIASMKINNHITTDLFHRFIDNEKQCTAEDNGILASETEKLSDILEELAVFFDGLPIIAFDADIFMEFLLLACAKVGLQLFTNRTICVKKLVQRITPETYCDNIRAYVEELEISNNDIPDTYLDCEVIKDLYEKLIKSI